MTKRIAQAMTIPLLAWMAKQLLDVGASERIEADMANLRKKFPPQLRNKKLEFGYQIWGLEVDSNKVYVISKDPNKLVEFINYLEEWVFQKNPIAKFIQKKLGEGGPFFKVECLENLGERIFRKNVQNHLGEDVSSSFKPNPILDSIQKKLKQKKDD